MRFWPRKKNFVQNCQNNEQLLYFQQPSRAAQKKIYLMIVDKKNFRAFLPVVYVSQPSAFWPMSDWSLCIFYTEILIFFPGVSLPNYMVYSMVSNRSKENSVQPKRMSSLFENC